MMMVSHLIVSSSFVCVKDPGSFAGASLANVRTSLAGQVKD